MVDEPAHLSPGLEAWRYGCFRCWGEHTPLSRLLTTAPLLAAGAQIEMRSGEATGMYPSPQEIAWLARPVSVVFGVILAVLLWITARAHFSEGGANLALALFAFSPSLVAHFSLATTDGLGILMIFATAAALVFWRARPGLPRTLLLGVVLGLLLLAKLYTPPIFLAALILVFLARPALAGLRTLLLLVGIAALVVWAGYFFHVSGSPVYSEMTGHHSRDEVQLTGVRFPIPAREYWEGLASIATDVKDGYYGFFLGKMYPRGVGLPYFPVVIALKWPPWILLLLVAVVAVNRAEIQRRRDLLPFIVFPALFLGLALFSQLNLGERHILTIYPFALLAIASLWKPLSSSRSGLFVVILLVAGQAADTLRYAPHYLSYFTPLVPAGRAHEYLADSNLDWGQALISLRDFEARNPEEKATLLYFGGLDPALYGIRAERYDPEKEVRRTVIISASCLSLADIDHPYGRFASIYRRVRPVEILGHGLYVFRRK